MAHSTFPKRNTLIRIKNIVHSCWKTQNIDKSIGINRTRSVQWILFEIQNRVIIVENFLNLSFSKSKFQYEEFVGKIKGLRRGMSREESKKTMLMPSTFLWIIK